VEGAKKIRMERTGGLEIETAEGRVELKQPKAWAYEGGEAEKRPVGVKYVWAGKDEVGFKVVGWRRGERVVIDPVLTYSTYLGGSGGDMGYAVAVDSSGDAYVTGSTASTNFPVKSPEQPTNHGVTDAFVTEVNPAGTAIVFSTYLGGSGADSAQGIALDSADNIYLTGTTASGDFPVTTGAFQTALGTSQAPTGGTIMTASNNAFVAKLNAGGSALAYATYLGGSTAEYGQAIAVDSSGNAYVTGSTQSSDFPVKNPLQVGLNGLSDAFITEVNPTGTALVFSTYWGGSGTESGQAIALDTQKDIYVGGYTTSTDLPTDSPLQATYAGDTDGFVAEFAPSGASVVFSTYLGGSSLDEVLGLAVDSAGEIYVAGETQSDDLPVTPGAFQTSYGGATDGFAAKLAQKGTAITFLTYIGGSGLDEANGIALDSFGDAFVVGYTQSSDFPLLNPLQQIIGIYGAGSCISATTGQPGVCTDAFVTELTPSGTANYSTYLGGTNNDAAQAVAVDSSGFPYVIGTTQSSNFPVIAGALQGAYAGSGSSDNAFIAKIDSSNDPGVALTPQVINFGSQTLNISSAQQTIILVNEGSAPLDIDQITVPAPFTQTNNCGTSLPASGGNCTINVTFKPTVTGSVTDELTIIDNAAGSPQQVAVNGTGTEGGAGTLTVTPSTLTFSGQPIATTSAPQEVTIINNSSAAVTITAISISGDFSETNTCPATPFVLNVGSSCGAFITFAPTTGGSLTGTFTVTSNSAAAASASLTGTGATPFTLSITPPSNTILVGTTKTTFTVAATAPPTFTSNISMSCSSGVTCSFYPASITAGQSSAVTVTGLSSTSSNPTNITVTGTASSLTSTVAVSVFLQDFTVTETPLLQTVTAGAATNYTITVNPVNGFNSVVALSCSAGLPANSTCAFDPPVVTPNGTTGTTSVLTISTESQVSSSNSQGLPGFRLPGSPGLGPRNPRWPLWAGAIMLLLLGLGSVAARKRKGIRTRTAWIIAALGLILLSLGTVSCNDLYYYNNVSPSPVGTPSGTFTITIKGALGSDTSIVRNTTVNLTVSPSS
jgi:hypothetical protein